MTIGRNQTFHLKKLFDKDSIKHLREFYKTNKYLNEQTSTIREKIAVERGEGSDVLRLQADWYSIWSTIDANAIKIFGDYRYILYPPQIREVRSLRNNVPWHQDIGYMRKLGINAPTKIITCFVPLDEFPYSHTTLQFIEGSDFDELEHEPKNGFGAGLNIDESKYKTRVYDCDSGDALVFGDYVVHRTFTPENKDIKRLSIEFRLLCQNDLLRNKDYYDIRSNRFIKIS